MTQRGIGRCALAAVLFGAKQSSPVATSTATHTRRWCTRTPTSPTSTNTPDSRSQSHVSSSDHGVIRWGRDTCDCDCGGQGLAVAR